jgi:hypothetical protein
MLIEMRVKCPVDIWKRQMSTPSIAIFIIDISFIFFRVYFLSNKTVKLAGKALTPEEEFEI